MFFLCQGWLARLGAVGSETNGWLVVAVACTLWEAFWLPVVFQHLGESASVPHFSIFTKMSMRADSFMCASEEEIPATQPSPEGSTLGLHAVQGGVSLRNTPKVKHEVASPTPASTPASDRVRRRLLQESEDPIPPAVLDFAAVAADRSILSGIVKVTEKVDRAGITKGQLFALTPEVVALLYEEDAFRGGSGYQEMAAIFGQVLERVLDNKGSDENGSRSWFCS